MSQPPTSRPAVTDRPISVTSATTSARAKPAVLRMFSMFGIRPPTEKDTRVKEKASTQKR